MEPTTSDDLLLPLSDGKVIMGLYPVLFGWRVRAGKVGDLWYHCDWCCGDDEKVVWATYEMMRHLLENYDMMRLPTCSLVKPWPKDVQFIVELAKLLNGWEVKMVGVRPSLAELRVTYMQRLLVPDHTPPSPAS